MIDVGRPEVIDTWRRQEWSGAVSALLAHSNRYGWVARLGGSWNGPVDRSFPSRKAAVAYVEAWVAESPAARCAFIAGDA